MKTIDSRYNGTRHAALRNVMMTLVVTAGASGSLLCAQSAYAIAGQCKDMEIKFVNSTGLTITIPQEGHRVKNPGGLEGFNNLSLGGSVNDLAAGKTSSVRQTLNIKCVNDAQFEIHYSAKSGRDFTQVFEKQNIEDKYTTLTLTHN